MIKKGLSGIGIFFLYLMSLLPFWILYRISDLLFVLLFYITGYRRKVVQENLRNSFPQKSQAELDAIEKKYFRYLADLIVEVIKMFTISKRQIAKRMVGTNPEIMKEYFDRGKSIICAVGHYGNWELAGMQLSLVTDERRLVVYKPLSNEHFDEAFLKMRSRFGATLVNMKNTMRRMVEFRKELMFAALVSDQTPVKGEATYFTTFLNQPTAVFLGIEKLAKMLDCAVFYCDIRRVKRGYYKGTLIPLFDNPKATAEYEITEAHVRCLENIINEEPQYWLWSHRRWKFKPGDNN